jgi:hypothetical protein
MRSFPVKFNPVMTGPAVIFSLHKSQPPVPGPTPLNRSCVKKTFCNDPGQKRDDCFLPVATIGTEIPGALVQATVPGSLPGKFFWSTPPSCHSAFLQRISCRNLVLSVRFVIPQQTTGQGIFAYAPGKTGFETWTERVVRRNGGV